MKIGVAFGLLLLVAPPVVGDEPVATSSLRAKFGPRFVVGVALGGRVPDDYSAGRAEADPRAVRRRHARELHEDDRHPAAGKGSSTSSRPTPWWRSPRSTSSRSVGHTLVWAKDERTPAWVFLDGDKPASRELVLDRMQDAHPDGRRAISRQDRLVGRGQRGPRRQRAVPPAVELADARRARVHRPGVRVGPRGRPRRPARLQRLQRRAAREAREAAPADPRASREERPARRHRASRGTGRSTRSPSARSRTCSPR